MLPAKVISFMILDINTRSSARPASSSPSRKDASLLTRHITLWHTRMIKLTGWAPKQSAGVELLRVDPEGLLVKVQVVSSPISAVFTHGARGHSTLVG